MQFGFLRSQPVRRIGWGFAGLVGAVGLIVLLAGIFHAAWASRLEETIGSASTPSMRTVAALETLQAELGPLGFLKHMNDYVLGRPDAAQRMRRAVDRAHDTAASLRGIDALAGKPGLEVELQSVVQQYDALVTAIETAQDAGSATQVLTMDRRLAMAVNADGLERTVAAIHRQIVDRTVEDLSAIASRATGFMVLSGLLLLAAAAGAALLVLWRVAQPFYALQLSLAERAGPQAPVQPIWGVERADEFGHLARLVDLLVARRDSGFVPAEAMAPMEAHAPHAGGLLPQELFEAVDRRLAANTASVDGIAAVLQQDVADRLRRVQDVQTAMARLLTDMREQVAAQADRSVAEQPAPVDMTAVTLAPEAMAALQAQLAEMAAQIGQGLDHTGASIAQMHGQMQRLSEVTGSVEAAELLQALTQEQGLQHSLLQQLNERIGALATLPETLSTLPEALQPVILDAVAQGQTGMAESVAVLGSQVEGSRAAVAQDLARLEPLLARAAGQLAEAAQAVQKLSGAGAERMGEKLAARLQPLLEVLRTTASSAGGARMVVPAVELAEAPEDRSDLRRHVSLLTGQVVTLSQGAARLAREALAAGAVAPPVGEDAVLDGESRALVDSLMAMVDLLTDVARSVAILSDATEAEPEARWA